jgi:putative MATE family efflux protein
MTLLAQNVVNVTNTAFLGHVGELELGASAIGGVFFIALFMIGFGFSQGAQILIGRRNGEKEWSEIGKIFNNGLVFNLLLAGFIFLLSRLCMASLLKHMVASEEICNVSIDYLNWRIYGIFFAFLNVMFRAFFVGITETKILSISAIITALVNILFDYLLIFGVWIFPAMGIKGAAISSIIAEGVSSIYLIIYTLRRTNIKQYGLFSFLSFDFKIIKKTLSLSIYIMFQYFISISTWFVFFILIERTGERPLAVSNIVRSLYTLLMIPAIAFGTTTSTIISNMIGEGRKNEVNPFLKRMIYKNGLITIPFFLMLAVFPHLLARIYTSNNDLMNATAPVIQVFSGALLLLGTGMILFSAVQATGNTRIAFGIELFVLFFYLSYTYYTTMIVPCQVAVVWFAEYIYWILIGLLSYIYLKKGNWRKMEI